MYVSLEIPAKLGRAIINRMTRNTDLFHSMMFDHEWYVDQVIEGSLPPNLSESKYRFSIDGSRGLVFDDIKASLGQGVWNRLKKMPVISYHTSQESWKWYEQESDRSLAEQKYLFRGRIREMSVRELEAMQDLYMELSLIQPDMFLNVKLEMLSEQIKKAYDHLAFEARETMRKITTFKAKNSALIQRATSGSLSAAKAKWQLKNALYNEGLELHHLNDQE